MRSGFVAVAGRPNVGKSTLVNALCGGKVAIVSDKPQTTRRRIFGIANGDDYQLVLADLPGFQRPRDALTERMQRTVDASFEDVDAVLFVVDCARAHRRRRPLHRATRLRARRPGRDRGQQGRPPEARPHRHADAAAAAQLGAFHALHPVSAKTGDGIGELRDELVGLLPEGPLYFPPEQRTDLSVETQIAELVREKALALTREEVPHAITVEVEEIDEKVVRAILSSRRSRRRGSSSARAARWCAKIGMQRPPARSSSSSASTIFLELHVKVRPKMAPRRGAARALWHLNDVVSRTTAR